MKQPRRLTRKHQLFVAEYLKDLNATQAAIRAGYSASSARVNGPRMLQHAAIAAEISARQGKQLEKADLTADKVKESLRRVLAADIRSIFDEHGNLRPIHELSDEAASLIAGCEVVKRNLVAGDGKTDTIIKLKMVDRSKYVEMAAKHFGLLVERVDMTVMDRAATQAKLDAFPPEEVQEKLAKLLEMQEFIDHVSKK